MIISDAINPIFIDLSGCFLDYYNGKFSCRMAAMAREAPFKD